MTHFKQSTDKKEAELVLIEHLITSELQGTKWAESPPGGGDLDQLIAEVKAAKEKAEAAAKEINEKKARGEPVEEPPDHEMFKNCGGDPKKMMQKFIDSNLVVDRFGLPKFYQGDNGIDLID